ncbi:MAG: ATPase [Alphaproteobacteria bacterium]|nr:ATPase [Alphaproteobacteria bacterium]|tara:strand:- start:27223 stop:28380 length:1158 start_codon:yes stop_codon:yes gene_type:complete
MAAREPISLVKAEDTHAQTYPSEPERFTENEIDDFLLWCVKQGSSDITIQSERQVYNEIHGLLHPGTVRSMDAADMAAFLQTIYGAEAQARLASGRDLDISYEIRPDRYTRIRFRVNITAILSKGRDGAQITMRALPSEPPTMDDLDIEQEIRDAWAPRQGLVIITGPTGSGKSTLLASGNRMLLERGEGCGKMLTYEAPIEYVYDTIESPRSLVSQTEIPRHLPSFAHGIRNALRRKPEVILVGEARDRETIDSSIEAAQTGHAVYTTTHTLGVANTIQRMLSTYEMKEREERSIALMETLRLIVTQALVPRTGGGRIGVREWMKFPDEVREKLMDMHFTDWPNEIQRMIDQYGQTMERSAEIVFEQGIISRRHYLLLSSSTGS